MNDYNTNKFTKEELRKKLNKYKMKELKVIFAIKRALGYVPDIILEIEYTLDEDIITFVYNAILASVKPASLRYVLDNILTHDDHCRRLNKKIFDLYINSDIDIFSICNIYKYNTNMAIQIMDDLKNGIIEEQFLSFIDKDISKDDYDKIVELYDEVGYDFFNKYVVTAISTEDQLNECIEKFNKEKLIDRILS